MNVKEAQLFERRKLGPVFKHSRLVESNASLGWAVDTNACVELTDSFPSAVPSPKLNRTSFLSKAQKLHQHVTCCSDPRFNTQRTVFLEISQNGIQFNRAASTVARNRLHIACIRFFNNFHWSQVKSISFHPPNESTLSFKF